MRINNGYRVQPIKPISNIGYSYNENNEKREQGKKKDKKINNEFTEILKSKFDVKI